MSENSTFEAVYKEHLANVVNTCTFLVGSYSKAEEIAHDAFIKLHDNWFSVRNPAGFVKVVAINRCKDIIRSEQRSQKRLRLMHNTEKSKTQSENYLVDVLQELKPKRRMIVVLRFYGGYKISEIAEYLEIPEGTVESNLHRAIDQLGEMLPKNDS